MIYSRNPHKFCEMTAGVEKMTMEQHDKAYHGGRKAIAVKGQEEQSLPVTVFTQKSEGRMPNVVIRTKNNV